MGGLRAAVAASVVSAEKDGTGAAGAEKKLADAGFSIAETPYPAFIASYFAT